MGGCSSVLASSRHHQSTINNNVVVSISNVKGEKFSTAANNTNKIDELEDVKLNTSVSQPHPIQKTSSLKDQINNESSNRDIIHVSASKGLSNDVNSRDLESPEVVDASAPPTANLPHSSSTPSSPSSPPPLSESSSSSSSPPLTSPEPVKTDAKWEIPLKSVMPPPATDSQKQEPPDKKPFFFKHLHQSEDSSFSSSPDGMRMFDYMSSLPADEYYDPISMSYKPQTPPPPPKDYILPPLPTTPTETRKLLIQGDLRPLFQTLPTTSTSSTQTLSKASWTAPTPKLQVFVSSTFTDTHPERNHLLEHILPRLRDRARQSHNNIQVTFADMRWGVRDENTLDHRTWDECKAELERCRRVSTGLFFLSLQGDKYGYMPLPRVVPKHVLDQRLIEAASTPVELARKWYLLDTNAVPPVYELKPLENMGDQEFWTLVLPELRGLFKGVCFETALVAPDTPSTHNQQNLAQLSESLPQPLLIGKSVTEWEARTALVDPRDFSRAFWLHRSFVKSSITKDRDPREFLFDTHDSERLSHIQQLKEWMQHRLAPVSRIINFPEIDISEYNSGESTRWKEYLSSWSESLTTLLNQELSQIITQTLQWEKDSHGLGIPGPLAQELLHHLQFAMERQASFVGRQTLLDSIMDTLTNFIAMQISMQKSRPLETLKASMLADEANIYGKKPKPEVKKKYQPPPLECVTMYLLGSSGSGKSAMISKLAEMLHQKELQKHHADSTKKPLPIIMRFLGTSSESTSGSKLVASLIAQLQMINDEPVVDTKFMNYEARVTMFHKLMEKTPCILLLDALDQLSNADLARSYLSFLAGMKCHKDSIIVVSTLPDGDPNTDEQVFGCETQLRASSIPFVTVPKLGGGDSDKKTLEDGDYEGLQLLKHTLSVHQRQLNDAQLAAAQKSLGDTPTALQVILSARQLASLHSFDPPLSNLPRDVCGILDSVFANLERDFGARFTSTALALITFSHQGVSAQEIEDLVSLDAVTLDAVFQYATPNIRRLPSHVWLRLAGAMTGLITERESGVLTWYHRQVREAAERRYVSRKSDVKFLLAAYFSNQVSPQVCKNQLISPQPIGFFDGPNASVWQKKAKVNIRRAVEAPRHLLDCRFYGYAITELCDIERVCARIKIGEGFVLVEHLSEILEHVLDRGQLQNSAEILDPNGHCESISKVKVTPDSFKRLQEYHQFLYKHMNTLVSDPSLLLFVQCSLDEPADSIISQDLNSIIQNQESLQETPIENDFAWIRAKTFSDLPRFHDNIGVLKGHSGGIYGAKWSPDGKYLLSGDNFGKICLWRTLSGQLVSVMGVIGEEIESLAWHPDGKMAITGHKDGCVRVWNVFKATLVQTIEVDKSQRASHVEFSPGRGDRVLVGMRDVSARIYDQNWTLLHVVDKRQSSDELCCALWLESNLFLRSGFDDSEIINADTGELVMKLKDSAESRKYVTWSSTGRWIASAAEVCKLFNLDTGKRIWKARLGNDFNSASSIMSTNDSSYIIVGMERGDISVLLSSTGETVNSLMGHYLEVNTLHPHPDGKIIASGALDGQIMLWKVSTSKPKMDNLYEAKVFVWHPTQNKLLLGSNCLNYTRMRLSVHEWNPCMTMSTVWTYFSKEPSSPDKEMAAEDSLDSMESSTAQEDDGDEIGGASWSPSGEKIVVSSSKSKTLFIFEANSGEILKEIQTQHRNSIGFVNWFDDDSRVLTAGRGSELCIWDVVSGSKLEELEVSSMSGVYSFKWHPKAQLLALCLGDEGSSYFSLLTKQERNNSTSLFCSAIAINPGGTKLAVAFLKSHQRPGERSQMIPPAICLYDLEWNKLSQFDEPRLEIISLDWCTEDILVSGDNGFEVCVWNPQTWHCHASLRGHHSGVSSLSVNKDRTKIATAAGPTCIVYESLE